MNTLNRHQADSLQQKPLAGVGLRHGHYQDVLLSSAPDDNAGNALVSPDFIEVHSENFFADGSPAQTFLQQVATHYPVSLHGTAMGIGSAAGIHLDYLQQLKILVDAINPLMISDHACFCWSAEGSGWRHAGDLLPVPMDSVSLDIMVNNIQEVQQFLGRRLLIENIVAYVPQNADAMQETDFLQEMAYRSGCGLLIDLNNVLVNASNFSPSAGSGHKDSTLLTPSSLTQAMHWVSQLDAALVGEIHLAGCTQPEPGALIIDDHAQPVSAESWALYEYAIAHLGPLATLIERANNLPSWPELLSEASHARNLLNKVQESRHVA